MPVIETAFLSAVDIHAAERDEVLRRLNTFRQQVMNIKLIQELMVRYNVKLNIHNLQVDAKQFPSVYEDLCEFQLFGPSTLVDELDRAWRMLPSFPLERVREIDSAARIEPVEAQNLWQNQPPILFTVFNSQEINTSGGTYVGGSVHIDQGNFIGRDSIAPPN
jgi:hypothetical protein